MRITSTWSLQSLVILVPFLLPKWQRTEVSEVHSDRTTSDLDTDLSVKGPICTSQSLNNGFIFDQLHLVVSAGTISTFKNRLVKFCMTTKQISMASGTVAILWIIDRMINSYFSDTEAIEACIRLLNVMWCDVICGFQVVNSGVPLGLPGVRKWTGSTEIKETAR